MHVHGNMMELEKLPSYGGKSRKKRGYEAKQTP